MGHYLRVQEAASLLGVAPTTVRWYCTQDWLPTYWVGRGQVGHRRFLYSDVEALGKRLGRVIPPEKDWSVQSEWDVSALSEYLGLSTKFLTSIGVAQPGMKFTRDEVQQVESEIYGRTEESYGKTEDKEEERELQMETDGGMMGARKHGRREHNHGGREHRGGPGFSHHGPWGFGPNRDPRLNPQFGFAPDRRVVPGWGAAQDWLDNIDATNLLALKQSLRHLEAQKLDLEDVIAELKKKIEMHPDYEEN
jgi:hypothetical protein